MSHWEKNREILLRQYGGLLEELSSEKDDLLKEEDIKIEETPSGEHSLCIKGIHVHSQRDPLREGQRLAEAAKAESGPVIILGFGLGYAALAAAGLKRPVIIVEKYRALLLKAFELCDFTEFLAKNKIIFIIGGTGEQINGALEIAWELIIAEDPIAKKAVSVIRNRALISLDEKWYKPIEDRIRTWTMRDDVNMATLKKFGKRWVKNLSRNITSIRDRPGVSWLTNIAKKINREDLARRHKDTENTKEDLGLPVFLAAAGPSLDKVQKYLREIYERCIIVAVDTSLRFFVKNGIEPDFVVTVDPQFWNSRHLDRCFCERTALIAESAVFPPVLSLPFKNIFLCGSLFPLGTFIENQVDPKGRLGAGGSVATTAWDFARTLGSNEIWIAGLDLAFPDLKTHFRGARFEERANSESFRFSPAEKWVLRALRDGFPFRAGSLSGAKVLTDRRLSLYAAWFESQFRKYQDVKNYSLSKDGLAIPGLHAADISALLALPPRRAEIDRRINETFSQIKTAFNKSEEARLRQERFENALTGLKRGINSIKRAAEEGAAITRQALKRDLNPQQQNKVLKELDDITRRVAESEVKEVAGFLFPPADAAEAAGKGEGDPFRAYLKSSLKLFSGLAEAASFNLF